MKSVKYFKCIIWIMTASCIFFSSVAFSQVKNFDGIVVLGTSLSDSGNAFVLLSDPAAFGFSTECIGKMGVSANVPPYDQLDEFLVPNGSYARGGHHETNGATWIEQFAQGKGLSGYTRPALQSTTTKARNYAVGGARAGDYPCRFNLSDQLNTYMSDFPETSPNALVVIEMGGNDVRDALVTQNPTLIVAALTNIGNAIQTLYGQGARKFLLVNVPAIGATPAVKIIDDKFGGTGAIIAAANSLAEAFDGGLADLQKGLNALPGADIRMLDLHALLNEIIADPASFGITNTSDACVTPNLPPYKCQKPDTYLFWDGIHPTKVVHGIMAQRAAVVLLAPKP
ncbi:SGNH/GDSL hydrolase family protein [Methylomicrobium sp. Wu6]|uniref:SGNH/GDSL hydrolase family protein n=1 Tax=Methylomicrobium sp. Wu6 TaxID=3107928 RepID=UPI002DD68581|nr:SGNH/GDSL hydrolase family protein [Methylomicrobium sp. Wu6]MEC4748939.1 SGNH/GDSL hydrolase family protein [Methylomicrobium sp. Wu6]